MSAANVFASVPEGIKVMSVGEYQVMHRLMKVMLVTQGTDVVPTSEIPVMHKHWMQLFLQPWKPTF